MKECYFCNSSIPNDATVCPMCGLDLTEVEETIVEEDVEIQETEIPAYSPNKKIKSRREENGMNFEKVSTTFTNYFRYYLKKVTHPVQIDYRSERHPFYGYVNILVASLFSAGIITRVVSAMDETYQFMLELSILPSLTFEMNRFEWFWKLSIFFLFFFFLYGATAYLFKKLSTKQPLNFHNWMTQFSSMNAFYFLLLCVAFLLAMLVPIGLAVPSLLLTLLHAMAYLIAFHTTLYTTDREGKENKTFYQALLGMSLHFIIMTILAYFLIKL